MTTPQSGREAFEEAASRVYGLASRKAREVMFMRMPVADGEQYCNQPMEWAHQIWQAALAQQGREAGEVWQVRVFPVAVNGEDDAHCVEMKRGVQSFRVGHDYWDTREEAEAYAGQLRIALAAPKQQAVEVTEEMVERLRDHLGELRYYYVEARDFVRGYSHREAQYTRLIEEVDADLAALSGKTEVDRG